MCFSNRHLSQRQVINFSIKCDEAWEIVNTIMVRLKKNLKSQNYMKIMRKNLIGIANLHISTIVLLNAGTVPRQCDIYFFHFIIGYEKKKLSCNC